jgi:predicted nucleic acid-binding protein
MMPKIRKVFLDTSVVFAAVLSPGGGARKLFQLSEAGVLQLFVGQNVLRECEVVVLRKAPGSLPTLALLLDVGRVEIAPIPTTKQVKKARGIVTYGPDALVLAEAMAAEPDWFITHDSAHFLNESKVSDLNFKVGTPGDLILFLREDFTYP